MADREIQALERDFRLRIARWLQPSKVPWNDRRCLEHWKMRVAEQETSFGAHEKRDSVGSMKDSTSTREHSPTLDGGARPGQISITLAGRTILNLGTPRC